MTIYDPVFDGTGIFSGGELGKNYPTVGPFKNFKPRLSGRGGRFGPVISGAKYIGRYFRKNPRFGARIGAVVTGAAVEYATRSKYRQTYRAATNIYGGSRRYSKYNNGSCCKQCTCKPNKRNSRRR